ncbi:tyrosine-type recombinase/integrase [Deinococcus apachensis]|uniref:tyrosine-type recombinase/integrase n=1 Tax=Deinococcus apachensis TaxID=309886 RepID=UPI00037A32BD|nr:site-specific integrase [Deinococcus apachensis]
MAKRANGEGTLSRRKDKNGKTVGWRAAVTVGTKADGKPDRVWVSGKTQEEVREGMQRVVSEHNSGMLARTQGITAAAYLDQWIDHVRGRLRPKSEADYRRVVEKRLKPNLGKLALDKLRPLDVERLVRTVRDEVSASEAKRTLTILSMALGQAVKWQMLPRNVAKAVDAPKVEKKEMMVWEPREVVRFLAHAQTHRLYAFFHLALETGMRCGELQALRWADVTESKAHDPSAGETVRRGVVNVRQTVTELGGVMTFGPPKSRASKRRIHITAGTLDLLDAHKRRQAAERAALGEGWQDTDLVFTTELGAAVDNGRLHRVFKPLAEGAEVQRIRIHDLRHTAITAMIRRGYGPKLVADIAGHADPAFTLREYAHVWEEERREFAPSAAELYGSLPRIVGVN